MDGIDQIIEKYKTATFEWGTCDCSSFVLDLLSERFNDKKYPELEYTTEAEAVKFASSICWIDELRRIHNDRIKVSETLEEIPDHDQVVLFLKKAEPISYAGIIYNSNFYTFEKKGLVIIDLKKNFFVTRLVKGLYIWLG